MINNFMSLFSHEILVRIGKDECIYQVEGKKPMILKTKIFLSSSNTIIAGIGTYSGAEEVTCLNIFDKLDYIGIQKFGMLERYFRFAIEKLHSRSFFVRPKIIIESTNELKSLFHGYEEFIIKEALFTAGAMTVYFLDTKNKYDLK